MDMRSVEKILDDNRGVGFVDRVLNPNKYPSIQNPDGSISTHKMSYVSGDDKFYVFPTILNGKDGLTEYLPMEAWEHVKQSGNFISFDNEKDAAEFSKDYKKVWKNMGVGK